MLHTLTFLPTPNHACARMHTHIHTHNIMTFMTFMNVIRSPQMYDLTTSMTLCSAQEYFPSSSKEIDHAPQISPCRRHRQSHYPWL